MKVDDFFIKAIKAKAFQRRSWILSLFSLYQPGKDLPPYLVQRDGASVFFIDPDSNQRVTLDVKDASLPLLSPLDPITIKPGDLANVNSVMTVSYGNVLFNAITLADVFGDVIPFQTGRVKAKSVEAIMAPMLRDGRITPKQRVRFSDAVAYLGGLTQVTVPSVSAQSLTGHPDRHKLKKELFEKYADSLDDPATIAKIDKEFEKMDREWIAKSPSAGFYIKDKSFKITRKRMYYMLGAEQSRYSKKLHLVANSLAEGINIEDLPAVLTTQRLGAFSRGANTALGGEAVKFYLRAFQNTYIDREDCGTKLGATYRVNARTASRFVDLYEIVNGKTQLIDEARSKELIGKTVTVRSPFYCRSEQSALCFKCMGEVNRYNEKALAEMASDIGSTILGISMSLAHGNALEIVDYNPIQSLH